MRPRPPASGRSRRSASESRWSSRAELTRNVRDLLDPVAEAELRRELAVGRAEPADEAGHDVVLGVRERGEERPRIAMAEERARVRDPEPVARVVLEPLEVVEVAAVRDRLDPGGAELPHLLRDRVRDGDHGVGPPRDEACDHRLRTLLDPHGEAVDPPVGVRRDRVAQVGDPRNAGRLLDGGADQVERRRRRGRDEDVDLLLLDDAACRRDRGQAPADELVRHEQPPGKERGLAQQRGRNLRARAAPPSEAAR